MGLHINLIVLFSSAATVKRRINLESNLKICPRAIVEMCCGFDRPFISFKC